MSIYLDIEKVLDGFTLHMQLEAENIPIALLGASGSGKSMTLRCIAGIEKPDRGKIILDDICVFDSEKQIDLSPQERGVGLLFQNYALFPTMTVRQNILCGARKSRNYSIVDTLLKRFELEELQHRLPRELSGGQQQRTALARILAGQPRILLLDEPFSALDSFLRWQIEQQVAEVIESFSGTAILVSHNKEEAYRLCKQIAVVEQGRTMGLRDRAELFTHPQTRAEARLIGIENVADLRIISDHTAEAVPWGCHVPLPQSRRDVSAVAISADAWTSERCEADDIMLTGVIVKVVQDLARTIVFVRPDAGQGTIQWHTAQTAPETGTAVRLFVSRRHLHFLTESF